MLIGVLADSHDHLDHLQTAVESLDRRGVQAVLHAGDFVAPFTIPLLAKLKVPVHGVFGNNDGERVGLKARWGDMGSLAERPNELELEGHKILLEHEPVALEALAGGYYHLVVYGHTHRLDIRPGATLIVNPGEVCGWLTRRPTAAVVDLANQEVEVIDLA